MKKELKLKTGDRVWFKMPTNGIIKRINKKYGYTILTDEGIETQYFGDSEVEKVD